ncbi:MAG: serine protease [bacterium]|nr:serine protease [bacterium]
MKWKILVTLMAFFFLFLPIKAIASESLIEYIAREEKTFRVSIFAKQVRVFANRLVRGDLTKYTNATAVIIGHESRDNKDKDFFYVITAAHVLSEYDQPASTISLYVIFPMKKQVADSEPVHYKAELLFPINWVLEYAFLKVEVPKNDLDNLNIQVAAISQEIPKLLEEFWISGFYQSKYLVVNKAYLSNVVKNEKSNTNGMPYLITTNLYFIASGVNGPGMSGGGIFNLKGELVALFWAFEGQNIVIAVPALLIKENFTEKLKSLEQERQK